jgi:hypothetical protein
VTARRRRRRRRRICGMDSVSSTGEIAGWFMCIHSINENISKYMGKKLGT